MAEASRVDAAPIKIRNAGRTNDHRLRTLAAGRRTDNDGTAKSDKDRDQAVTLMNAMIETRQSEALAETYMEAWDRGPAWRDAIGASLRAVSEDTRAQLLAPLAASVRALGVDPASYHLPT